MYDWRGGFNESELAEIDAASPRSLLGRMAAILDRLTKSRADRSSITVDFSRRTKRRSDVKDFED